MTVNGSELPAKVTIRYPHGMTATLRKVDQNAFLTLYASDDLKAYTVTMETPRRSDQQQELREALEAVLADIKDYERANNLVPNPGHTHCWDSVARAYAVLKCPSENVGLSEGGIADASRRLKPPIIKRVIQAWQITLTEPSADWDMQPPIDERYTQYTLTDDERFAVRDALGTLAQGPASKCVAEHMGGARCIDRCSNPMDCTEIPLRDHAQRSLDSRDGPYVSAECLVDRGELRKLFNEHYWDSLEPEKALVLMHVKTVLALAHPVSDNSTAIAPHESKDDWQDDPAADKRWNAGCDFALEQLCEFLGVDKHAPCWDAATETVDGDVRAIIGNILREKFGEDWGPDNAHPQEAQLADALIVLAAEIEDDADNISPLNDKDRGRKNADQYRTYPADEMMKWARKLRELAAPRSQEAKEGQS